MKQKVGNARRGRTRFGRAPSAEKQGRTTAWKLDWKEP